MCRILSFLLVNRKIFFLSLERGEGMSQRPELHFHNQPLHGGVAMPRGSYCTDCCRCQMCLSNETWNNEGRLLI